MIKNLSSLILVLFLSGCSGLEFVYDNNNQKGNFLFLNTSVFAFGDENILVKNQLKEILKEPTQTQKYILKATAEKKLTNLIVETDQTATQIENTFIIKYILIDRESLCLIDEKEITTSLDYRVRSSGYNFGSDLSKKNVVVKNINKNIDTYLNYLFAKLSEIKCINDNQS